MYVCMICHVILAFTVPCSIAVDKAKALSLLKAALDSDDTPFRYHFQA